MGAENISIFDIFKICIGPSSSHTLGPWKAAQEFLFSLEKSDRLNDIVAINVTLFGSLAKTGIGHATDMAVMMGLRNEDVKTIDTAAIDPIVADIRERKHLHLWRRHTIEFDPAKDIIFNYFETEIAHPNAMTFCAVFSSGETNIETYYSIGGGFVVKEGDEVDPAKAQEQEKQFPFPIEKAVDLSEWCERENASIDEIVFRNEVTRRSRIEIETALDEIWLVMKQAAFLGCHCEGVLPGGLNVKRRAASINRRLLQENDQDDLDLWIEAIKASSRDIDSVTDWVTCIALATNEVNASHGRLVSAPTNGAAGVIPAVLFYYFCFEENVAIEDVRRFLLVASEIASIFKKGATISAALGGCQAEIGVSSAMAAAALTVCKEGSTAQALMAAEIAMEHHLGLTCDPVGGLVQIPCIERNTMCLRRP